MNVNGKLYLWIVLIADAGVFLILLPIMALRREMVLDDFLRVAALLVSWPVAASVMALLFIGRFHQAIDIFLRNVGTMKLPGGIELQRQEPVELATKSDHGPVGATPVEGDADKVVKELREVQGLSDRERSELQAQIAKLLDNIRYWKFAYLSLFFVEQTKNVLSWIASNPNTRQTIDLIFMSTTPNPNQRSTMLNVLLQNGMITELNGILQTTEEGVAFLRYIGRQP